MRQGCWALGSMSCSTFFFPFAGAFDPYRVVTSNSSNESILSSSSIILVRLVAFFPAGIAVFSAISARSPPKNSGAATCWLAPGCRAFRWIRHSGGCQFTSRAEPGPVMSLHLAPLSVSGPGQTPRPNGGMSSEGFGCEPGGGREYWYNSPR